MKSLLLFFGLAYLLFLTGCATSTPRIFDISLTEVKLENAAVYSIDEHGYQQVEITNVIIDRFNRKMKIYGTWLSYDPSLNRQLIHTLNNTEAEQGLKRVVIHLEKSLRYVEWVDLEEVKKE